MTRIATNVPAENDLLCEHCGYTLNGLPTDGRCPECGTPVADSIGTTRIAPAWEAAKSRRFMAFMRTTGRVIFKTTDFYRTLATRGNVKSARSFALIHWLIASSLFGFTAFMHLALMRQVPRLIGDTVPGWLNLVSGWILMFVTLGVLVGVTALAARLTNWEATYRGYRLTTPVVRRGMYYHAAHYLPAALVAFLTVYGYAFLLTRGILHRQYDVDYLYVVAGEVIVGAIYLFQTYWIAMRNMMYANR